MSSEKLNVGIIGAGHMGARHADCWSRLPNARVVAVSVADVQKNKADKLAMRLGENVSSFGSAEELLADKEVQAVSICVPTDQHRAVVEAAAAAGKHILCEKPMALTVDDCNAMIAVCDAAGVKFTIGQVVRFFPEYVNAKRLVDSGAVGKPAAVRTRRGGSFPRTDTDWYADPAKSGSVILDLMVHDLDWLQWCFGRITRVYARSLTERLASGELPYLDYALLTLRHESGVISHAEGTWADPGGFVTTFEIAGDAGLLSHDSRQARSLSIALHPEDHPGYRLGTGVTVPSSPLAAEDEPYFQQIASFAASILEDKPLAVTPQEACSAVGVALAAMESARTGEAVEINA